MLLIFIQAALIAIVCTSWGMFVQALVHAIKEKKNSTTLDALMLFAIAFCFTFGGLWLSGFLSGRMS